MKITALKTQVRDKNRINVSVDGKYRLSLDMMQVVELGIRVGLELTEEELQSIEEESQYGKLYTRSLEYVLMRPRSMREMRDYLYRKTRDTRTKTGDVRKGVSKDLTERVFNKLHDKGYLNDEKFAQFWIENRNLRKGSSIRKLKSELSSKGVSTEVMDKIFSQSERSDTEEIKKVIAKKAKRYDDSQKLVAYLARQGFRYDDIKEALQDIENIEDSI